MRGRHLLLVLAAGLSALIAPGVAAAASASPVPAGSGTWAYDDGRAGRWVNALNGYNQSAGAGHRLQIIQSYGTDLEMYCPGRDPARCRPGDLHSYYTADSDGRRSTAAYAARVPGAIVAPIVDGVVGASYLRGFNELSPALARSFADQVAGQFCADANVAGVQFDLEPFDVRTQNGQFEFYKRIADDFAAGDCVDSAHPSGRFWSIFTFASSIAPGSASAANVAAMFGDHDNGYVIDSMYDLSAKPGGYLSTPQQYARNARAEAQAMVQGADAIGVRYGFGILGGASAHEYTRCSGTGCHAATSGRAGYPMLQYVNAALPAITASGAREDPLFSGTYLWYFGTGPQQHPGYAVSPAPVQQNVLDYLASRL